MTITQERLKQLLSYDPDTGVFIRKQTSRGVVLEGKRTGSFDAYGYITIWLLGKNYKAHRLAWLYVYGELPGGHIDHKDGDRSNNSIHNLRDVIHIENIQNQRKSHKNSKLGIIGVCMKGGKYISQIKVSGKVTYLGSFSTKEEAYDRYIKAKREYHSTCTI